MLAGFLLAVREGLEAALVVGIVLGALQKVNRRDLRPVVWSGVGVAVLISLVAALLLHLLDVEFEGRAEQVFEGSAMLAAVVLLTWMIFWMRRQSASFQRKLDSDSKAAALQGGARSLFFLAFLAVAREGLELALFLTASALSSSAIQTFLGALTGLAFAVLLGYALFASTLRLNLKQFFQVLNFLLILFAAGLAAHGVHEFIEAGLLPVAIEHIWNLNSILSEQSTIGQLLGTLFGYSASPSLTEVSAYLGYLVLLWLLFRRNAQTAVKSL